MSGASDPLFAPVRVARDGVDRKSVIVVGLPRSGSSFLSHVMSQIPDWYVFDDLYLQRAAQEQGATGPLDAAALDRLLYFLGWQIRARKRHGLYAIPAMEEDEVEPMNAALKSVFDGQGLTWWDLQEEWLVRLAARSACTNWGYKMPGAFRRLDEILDTYPDMKAVFLMRSPDKVLASYKHMRDDSGDGDSAQYHPVAHAIYWRMAARAWQAAKRRYPDRAMLVRFEDLVADPTATARDLSLFLGAEAPEKVLAPERTNTSYKAGQKRDLTSTELAILRRLCAPEAAALGFPALPEGGVRPADLADLLGTSARFLAFRGGKIATRLKTRLAAKRS